MSEEKLTILQTASENLPEGRLPPWLRLSLPKGTGLAITQAILRKHNLNTVCEEAKCPNRWECYGKKTATFLALGKECTRSCGFCDIDFTKTPKAPDLQEPERIADCVADLGLRHVVVTMVARDDLPDGGAAHIALIIQTLRTRNSHLTIEVLTSDFNGSYKDLDTVLEQKPDVFNHNLETVRSLSKRVRHKATYDRSLSILQHASQVQKSLVKSGIMVGLGEDPMEVKKTIRDLANVGCNIVTIGQYLQAHRHRLPVKAFIPPHQFSEYEKFGKSVGIQEMYCGPFVRSSYNASEVQERAQVSSSLPLLEVD